MSWKERLKEIMKERGLAQKDLAQMMGVSSPSVCNMLQNDIRVSSLERIADAIGIPITDLFYSGEKQPDDVSGEGSGKSAAERFEEYRMTHVHGYLRIGNRIVEITSLEQLKDAVIDCEVNYLE